MKLLPCSTCNQPALATRSGILQSAGTLSMPEIRYLCRRCGLTSTITSAEFARLPLMTPEEMAAETHDLPWPPPPAE